MIIYTNDKYHDKQDSGYSVTLDKDFLVHSKAKHRNTMPLEMLIQASDEWTGSVVAAVGSHGHRHLNKAHMKIAMRGK